MKRISYSGFILTSILLGMLSAPVASAQTSSNSLLSLIKRNSGGIISAVISCNRSNINKALNKLKGGALTIEAVSVADKAVSDNSSDTAAQTKALQEKNTCKNAIEKAAAQAILKELTLRTVDWINHGFQNGDAIFSVDTSSFLKDLHDDQIRQFTSVIGFDPTNYPFGKSVARSILLSSRSYFERDMQYNLSKVVASAYPGRTPADFQNNFVIGGWDAFLAQSLPNNNPYGFQMSAQDELAARLADTAYSKAQDIKDQLQRNSGFLDLKKCVDPEGWNPKIIENSLAIESDPTIRQKIIEKYGCHRFETQTPGSIAASQLSTVLASPFKQLEIGQDLQASLTYIFDALTTQLLNKGLQSLESDDNYKPSSYSNNFSYNYASLFIDDGEFGTGGNGSEWWRDPNQFNILDLRSSQDGGRGVVMLIEREEAYAAVLNNSIDVVDEFLIPSIYQLDLCIPGPNPDWQSLAQDNIDTFLGRIPTNADDIASNGAKGAMKFLDPMGAIGPLVKSASEDSRNERLFSEIIGRTLGVEAGQDYKVNGYDTVVNTFYTILKRYKESIDLVYGKRLEHLPRSAGPARDYYRQLGSYKQSIADNQDLVGQTQSMISQLRRLQKLIGELPAETDPTYEGALEIVNRTFRRLAPDIITDDDLLSARDELQDYIDSNEEITVVPNGLLDDCIKETADGSYPEPKTRMYYPNDLIGPNPDGRVTSLRLGGTYLPEARYDGLGIVDQKPEFKSKLIDVNGLFTVFNQCIEYYDPQTVGYGTNVFGKPKAKGVGVGYPQNESCIEGFENLIGIY